MDSRTVELSAGAMVLFVIGTLTTFGVVAFILGWIIWFRYPHVIDREGVTTRSGARYRWADADEVLELRRRGHRSGLRISFKGGGRILVASHMIADGPEVLAFIESCGVAPSRAAT